MAEQIIHSQLLSTLKKVDRPGTICCSADVPIVMPGLEVPGIGMVSLPLQKTQAQQLIECCRQAPYGKGTQTLVDTDVRRAWELDPEQFHLTNPKWDDLVTSLTDDIKQQLGLEKHQLVAQLYKLLLYEQDSFFLPHRDGEKLDRMVATLVIGLPSIHEGGELIVSHHGQRHEIRFSGAASGLEISYAAFYADCQHEVRPVRSGFRLCLTYNVTLANKRRKKGLGAPSYNTAVSKISEQLRQWQAKPEAKKLAIILDHQYTQDGLNMATLKGVDQSRAEVLFAAAKKADCIAHLALVTLWESGSAVDDYDYSYHRGRQYYGPDEDENGDYEMEEIFEHNLSADHWSDRRGVRVKFGEIRLDEDEIVSQPALDEGDPDQEEFEGFTGNAGMTLERWYHGAGIIIWPRRLHFSVLCSAGTAAAIVGLEKMVKRLRRMTKARREQQLQQCQLFATQIIQSWQSSIASAIGNPKVESPRNIFPALLAELDAPLLMHQFLTQAMPFDGSVQLDKSFIKLCSQHGWLCFEEDLMAVIKNSVPQTILRNAGLLQLLCNNCGHDTDRLALCTRLSERMVTVLQAFDSRPQQPGYYRQSREPDRSELLSRLIDAMLEIRAITPLQHLIDHSLTCSNSYDLTEAHIAAIMRLESLLVRLPTTNPAIENWLNTCQKQLEMSTAEAPRKPADYRRNGKLSCHCADCNILGKFLLDPERQQARFALAQARRRHLHQIIEKNHCDLTHVTERKGRPYTLVCTKTIASYDNKRQLYERDLQHLSWLIELKRKMPQ